MAYNNGFPATYQPYYPQYSYQQQNAPQTNSSIIWVQGEAGAKSYLVAPNNTVQLWDSEQQTIYLKSADASGMPSMKILDYTIRDSSPVARSDAHLTKVQDLSSYATKAEIEGILAQIDAIKKDVNKMKEAEHE